MTENDETIFLTQEIIDEAQVSAPTVYSYLSRYVTMDNLPIGVKIGGWWKVYPERFRQFLKDGGLPKVR